MSKFGTNSRGIIQPSKSVIRCGAEITQYTKPNTSLQRVVRLMSGEKPRVCVQRKKGGLGDVLMTTPTVKSIAKRFNIKIDYATDFNYLDGALANVFINNPYVDRVIPFQEIRQEEYDAIIDLTCPCVAHEQPKAPPINRIDLFARHAMAYLEDHNIDYFITEDERKKATEYLIKNDLKRYKLIFVQPFSSAIARDMPASKVRAALIKVIQSNPDIRVIIITHNTDNHKFDWNINKAHVAYNLYMREIAAIMEQCNLIVCPDSSILHLASALHLKTFTLFGPTDPKARVNYHPEAVAYCPAKHIPSFPIWFSNFPGSDICWKMMEENIIAKSIHAMINDENLPNIDDFVTYGKYAKQF